jgi:hypothetical protein
MLNMKVMINPKQLGDINTDYTIWIFQLVNCFFIDMFEPVFLGVCIKWWFIWLSDTLCGYLMHCTFNDVEVYGLPTEKVSLHWGIKAYFGKSVSFYFCAYIYLFLLYWNFRLGWILRLISQNHSKVATFTALF